MRGWAGRHCLGVLMLDGGALLMLLGTECSQQSMQLSSSQGICPSERHDQGSRPAKPCCLDSSNPAYTAQQGRSICQDLV